MIIPNLFLIAVFWVLVLDIADFRTTIKQILAFGLSVYTHKKIPYQSISFEACTLCVTWWTGLIYLLFTNINLPLITLNLFFACLTPVIKDLIYLLIDLMQAIIELMSRNIQKI